MTDRWRDGTQESHSFWGGRTFLVFSGHMGTSASFAAMPNFKVGLKGCQKDPTHFSSISGTNSSTQAPPNPYPHPTLQPLRPASASDFRGVARLKQRVTQEEQQAPELRALRRADLGACWGAQGGPPGGFSCKMSSVSPFPPNGGGLSQVLHFILAAAFEGTPRIGL